MRARSREIPKLLFWVKHLKNYIFKITATYHIVQRVKPFKQFLNHVDLDESHIGLTMVMSWSLFMLNRNGRRLFVNHRQFTTNDIMLSAVKHDHTIQLRRPWTFVDTLSPLIKAKQPWGCSWWRHDMKTCKALQWGESNGHRWIPLIFFLTSLTSCVWNWHFILKILLRFPGVNEYVCQRLCVISCCWCLRG